MTEFRKVPEHRIKVLETIQSVRDIYGFPGATEAITEELIRGAGLELAKKLIEHHKVKKTVKNGELTLHFRVEVIVPEGPPE